MKKVSIISWNGINDVGGVERVMQLISEILSDLYEITIIDKEYCVKNVPKLSFLAKNKIGKMVLASIVAGKLKKDSLLIGNGFNAPFVYKDINFAHGTMYSLKKRINKFPWGGSSIFEKISMLNSKIILAVSEDAKESLIQNYNINKNKVRILNNCVDGERFFPVFTQDKERTNIIFVGRLEERKGVADVLKLAEHIEKCDNIKLYIATPDEENIDEFINFSNTEIKLGLSYDQMNEFYNMGNCMYFPSKSEGFEMVTLEALCAGVPVVCKGVGAGGEIMNKGGKGVYFAEDHIDDLIKQLIKLKNEYDNNDKKNELHDWVVEEYGKQKYNKRIKEIISEMFDAKE